MGEREELIERLEKATGPSDGLDAEIAILMGVRHRSRRVSAGPRKGVSKGREWLVDSHGGVEEWSNHPPAYTASLDAAMTLVPESYRLDQLGEWEALPLRAMGPWYAIVKRNGSPDWPPVESRADHFPSAALALCIAALRALSHSNTKGKGE